VGVVLQRAKTQGRKGPRSPSGATDQPLIDIGILTIRDDEFRAVLDAYPGGHGIHRGRHREYTMRTTDAGEGKRYRVAILRQIEQGNGEAQEAARDLIDDLQPSLLLVVGIAGGLPSDDISLGDVVLSTRVHDFSLEARKFEEATTYNQKNRLGELRPRWASIIITPTAEHLHRGGPFWHLSHPSRHAQLRSRSPVSRHPATTTSMCSGAGTPQ